MTIKFAILKNKFDDGHINWEKACSKFNVDFETIDLIAKNWLEIIMGSHFDAFLACPSGQESLLKVLYDERIYIIEKVMNKFIYPSYNEISIHENKRYLSYWLKANKLTHPKTFVFNKKIEAIQFANETSLPVVGKLNIGASGKGVKIFRKRESLQGYVNQAFDSGLKGKWGPNLKMGGYQKRISNLLRDPKRILKRLQIYRKDYNAVQKGFVIFQEFIPHGYEWRIVKIGDSYFGHQKVKQGDKASGTKGINYVPPSHELLNFTKKISNEYNFNSMAFDLFEDKKRGFLINELQCIFGHVQEYICSEHGRPGRYRFINNKWVFEEGLFNTNLSYDLRLENIFSLLKK